MTAATVLDERAAWVHFASDIVAGFASGAAGLALCIAVIGVAGSLQRRTVA